MTKLRPRNQRAPKWTLSFHELAANRENKSRRKPGGGNPGSFSPQQRVVVRKRERELNCINYRTGCIFTSLPRYANIVSPCLLVCALEDLLYGPLNLKSATLFSRRPR